MTSGRGINGGAPAHQHRLDASGNDVQIWMHASGDNLRQRMDASGNHIAPRMDASGNNLSPWMLHGAVSRPGVSSGSDYAGQSIGC